MDATSYSVAKCTLLYYMYVLQDYTILKVIVLVTVYCVLNFLNPLRFVHLYCIPIHKCITVSTVPRDWAFGRLYNYNLTILYTPRTLCIILTTIPLQFCQQFELKKQLEQLKCVPEIRYWLLEVLCN